MSLLVLHFTYLSPDKTRKSVFRNIHSARMFPHVSLFCQKLEPSGKHAWRTMNVSESIFSRFVRPLKVQSDTCNVY